MRVDDKNRAKYDRDPEAFVKGQREGGHYDYGYGSDDEELFRRGYHDIFMEILMEQLRRRRSYSFFTDDGFIYDYDYDEDRQFWRGLFRTRFGMSKGSV